MWPVYHGATLMQENACDPASEQPDERSVLCQVWDLPKWWSLRDAATVPVAYLTAYYALVMRGGLEKGHKVLVHSGTGAVGLAAIRICLHRGCEVSHPVPCHPI